MRVLLALVCLSAVSDVSAFRQRRHRRPKTGSAVGLSGADCDQLAGIVIGDRDLGQAAVLLCRFWPAQFGDFPVNTTQTVVELFNGAADLWEKIKELAKGRPGAPLCWKKFGIRQQLNQIHLTGLLEMNATEVAMSSDCDMEVLGKCYSTCPVGMKPMGLVGGFSPVCSSACIQSTHQTPCGFGCATGIGTCVQTLFDQASTVASAVGAVTSYLAGNPLINEVVNQVLRLVEFAIDVVFDVVRVAKHIWAEWPREQVELGIIIALVQFVLEHAKTIGQDLLQLDEMFGETMEMILELIDAEFDWREIDLEFIKDTVLRHGMSILGAANEFAEAFVYPQCEVVSNTNPDYDCNSNGERECGDWDYWGFRCDNGDQCEYSFKFGDLILDHSCRCKA